MSVVALLLGLATFVAVLRLLKVQQVATEVIATAGDAVAVMTHPGLTDDAKETRIRRASLGLFAKFLAIVAIGAAALAGSALIVWGGARLGLYDLDRAIEIALGWPFILGSSAAAIALWIGLEKRRGAGAGATEEVPYSPLDKALHDFAFAAPRRQITLGSAETALYRRRIDPGHAARPVFVTSLPRAGTTIMLNTLSALPEFASATYRHMPFTLSPLLWGGFSGRFRKAGGRSERAHGDGIEVGIDSPEAFEEMLWMAFWPEHYRPRHIRPWSADDRRPDFEAFFRDHIAKIVATKPGARRYVSKNNANIARLGLLETLFPDASVVVPVRDPRSQVASLMRQHARFGDLHAREPFAQRYMEGLGHFEFGAALRPIAFDDAPRDPDAAGTPDFWLRYWIAAYEEVQARAGAGTVFVDHDALCADPAGHLPVLAEAIGTDSPDLLADLAGEFRPPRPAPALGAADPGLVARAAELHAALRHRCLQPAMPRPRREVPA